MYNVSILLREYICYIHDILQLLCVMCYVMFDVLCHDQ